MVDAEIVQVQFYLDVISGWGGETGRTALNKQLDAHAGTDTGRPEYRQPAREDVSFMAPLSRLDGLELVR